jgi:hypothetical protein
MMGLDLRLGDDRAWGGFEVQYDRARMAIGGVLLDNMAIPEDINVFVIGPHAGQAALLFPQGGGRDRAYLTYQHDAPRLIG